MRIIKYSSRDWKLPFNASTETFHYHSREPRLSTCLETFHLLPKQRQIRVLTLKIKNDALLI